MRNPNHKIIAFSTMNKWKSKTEMKERTKSKRLQQVERFL